MKLNKISLSDKKIFDQYLGRVFCQLAAFSFTNIYIWRPLYDIRWAIIQKSLCVFFHDPVGCFMCLPPLTTQLQPAVIQQAFKIMDEINKNKDISRIENVQQQDLAYYRSLGYLCREKYPDYLCRRNDLALLRGNKFKSQRAAYNYFIKHYSYDWHILRLPDRAGCLSLFDSWAKERKEHSQDDVYCGMLEDNRKIIKDVLVNYKQLNLEGIAVRVNKEIKAFSFGYKLNSDTFCILYEIADLGVKGLAQFIFRQFAQELKFYKYINIMDDSGIENLRKTKLAYKPERLVPAYIVTKDDRKH
ncbi:MAG: phosphatidylglycerol lysyltransferase domain-containing protein [Candidatus Omnitrophica bacterium]|nr:phosphatidylglycerol lysyltransferase domain-containing protein [Candidatus Omnitrophota bacterium]